AVGVGPYVWLKAGEAGQAVELTIRDGVEVNNLPWSSSVAGDGADDFPGCIGKSDFAEFAGGARVDAELVIFAKVRSIDNVKYLGRHDRREELQDMAWYSKRLCRAAGDIGFKGVDGSQSLALTPIFIVRIFG